MIRGGVIIGRLMLPTRPATRTTCHPSLLLRRRKIAVRGQHGVPHAHAASRIAMADTFMLMHHSTERAARVWEPLVGHRRPSWWLWAVIP